MPKLLTDFIQMELENYIPIQIKPKARETQRETYHDCLRTSEKVRHLLAKFPASKPIMAKDLHYIGYPRKLNRLQKITMGGSDPHPIPSFPPNELEDMYDDQPGRDYDRMQPDIIKEGRSWSAVNKLVQLLQLGVTATAIALYYVIYGWMQFVYHGLRAAMYFRDSDGPMKATLGVVAVTSMIVGCNVLLRIRKIFSDILR